MAGAGRNGSIGSSPTSPTRFDVAHEGRSDRAHPRRALMGEEAAMQPRREAPGPLSAGQLPGVLFSGRRRNAGVRQRVWRRRRARAHEDGRWVGVRCRARGCIVLEWGEELEVESPPPPRAPVPCASQRTRLRWSRASGSEASRSGSCLSVLLVTPSRACALEAEHLGSVRKTRQTRSPCPARRPGLAHDPFYPISRPISPS